MAIWRGAGGSGDATTDAANEASVASTKAAEAEASATAAAGSATSAANSATNSASSATAAASSASAAANSASSASSSASDSSTSASAAANSATNSASSASDSATSASNSATSASNSASSASAAATSAANSANSATAASNSATAAASSETAAANSATSAAASYDSFDDRYLGAKSSDPSTDNDGDALTTGALYFNTTSNDMKVWTGSAWEVSYATLSGALVAANNLSDLTDAATARTNLGVTIGSDVQAYDADTAKYDDITANFTGTLQNGGSNVVVDSDIGSTVQAYDATILVDADIGVNVQAYSSVLAGTTASYTTAEETKLAGIEALADVTDTTNVTAAGAVMDSELTSEASVKALNQGVATTDSPSFAGLTTTANINFGDNDKAVFGASSDLQIYHDGGNSRIQDAGTGNLIIRSSSGTYIQGVNGENGVVVLEDASVSLWYDGSQKLATTSTGVDVTGTVLADGLTVQDASAGRVLTGIFQNTTNAAGTSSGISLRNSADTTSVNLTAERVGSNSGADLVITGFDNAGVEKNFMRITEGNDISFYDDTGTTPKFFWDASAEYLGIGTSSPASLLHLSSGSPRITLTDTGTGADHRINADSSVGNLAFDVDYNSDTASPVVVFNIKGSERMRITSAGNVGIGTTSPVCLLDVSASDSTGVSASTQVINTESSASLRIAATGTAFSTTGWIGVQDGVILRTGVNASGGLALTTGAAAPIIFGTSGYLERMRIDSSGNVGIGTSSPSEKLEVAGNIIAQGNSIALTQAGTADRHIEIGVGRTGNGNSYVDLIGDTTYTDYGVRFIRYNGGANTTSRIDHRGTGDLSLWATEAGALQFGTNATERMRIDSAGNVGIGTSSPGEKLDVQGNIRLTGGDTYIKFVNAGGYDFSIRGDSGNALRFYSPEYTANPLVSITNSGTFQFNSGYGSAATAYGCRAWVNFNGTGTVAIRASGNVSSITDSGVGDYRVNFSTAMPDTNYAVTGACQGVSGSDIVDFSIFGYGGSPVITPTTSQVAIGAFAFSGGSVDTAVVSVAIFR